jgi:ferritin-like metal-binding protein YciE
METHMNKDQQKVIQYLNEAHGTEQALVRELQAQIAMTPRGAYRSILETHLDETRRHADRVGRRLQALGQGGNVVTFVVGAVQGVVGQAMSIGRAPLELVRGSGGEEKVLKNAKDACASEALEIATYTAIERLAEQVGDEETAKLAASIRGDEERMLQRILKEIPKLTTAVVRAEVSGSASYDITKTGAADAVREASNVARETTRKAVSTAKRTSRQARKVPGVAQAEGQIKGAVASEEDLAIANYDSLNAEEVVAKLNDLSQIDLAKIDSYERKTQNRSTVLSRITSLRGDEPWAGYDELTAADVIAVLNEGDDDRARQVRTYERAHKNRVSVLKAAERELASA